MYPEFVGLPLVYKPVGGLVLYFVYEWNVYLVVGITKITNSAQFYRNIKSQNGLYVRFKRLWAGWVGGKGMTFGREQEETSPIGLPQDIAACEIGYHYGHRSMLNGAF